MFHSHQTKRSTLKTILTTKLNIAVVLLLSASLLNWTTGAVTQQTNPEQPAKAYQLSEADEKAIREIIKDQESAWNKHDMEAFTKPFRDDVEGINVVGLYWRGKKAVSKHLKDYHDTIFKDLEEYLEDVQVRSIGDGYVIAVNTWKVGSFKTPNGEVVPACRHLSTLVLAKGTDGWKVVHFHNTIIDEIAVKGTTAPPKK